MGVDMIFGISYGDDIDKVWEVIKCVLDVCLYVLGMFEIFIKVFLFGDSFVNFLVCFWIKSEYYWDIYFYM